MKFYLSNCLIEAVRAKLLCWKHVRILRLTKFYNIDGRNHYLWIDDRQPDFFFEFCAKHKKHNHFIFKGAVSGTPKKDIERLMNLAAKKHMSKVEKIFGIKFNQTTASNLLEDIDQYEWDYCNKLRLDDDSPYLPTLQEWENLPKPIFYSTEYGKQNVIKPMVLAHIANTNKCVYLTVNKEGIVNPENYEIDYWRWQFFSVPF